MYEYFKRILKSGEDTRGVGIVWVMHQITKLGKEVSEDMLPDCLDSKAKEFLLKTIDIDKENEKLKQRFKIFRKNLITE